MTVFRITVARGAKKRDVIVRCHRMSDAVVAAARRHPGMVVIGAEPIGVGSGASRFKTRPNIRRSSAREVVKWMDRMFPCRRLIEEPQPS